MYTEQDTFDRLRRTQTALNALRENGWIEIDYRLTLIKTVKSEQEDRIAARLAAGQ